MVTIFYQEKISLRFIHTNIKSKLLKTRPIPFTDGSLNKKTYVLHYNAVRKKFFKY